MSFAIYPAFVFTVVLLFTTAYFLLGGLPLLILKHDVPLDANFIRAFFNIYYKAAFWAAIAFVSGLTIGYGDLAPKMLLTRMLAIFIGLCGVLFTALIAAIAVKAFTDMTKEDPP